MSETTIAHDHDLKITFYESGYPNQVFLKTRVPYWYAQSSHELHIALYASQLKSHLSQCVLKELVAPIKSVYDFAWPLLNQQLQSQFNIHVDCRHLYLGTLNTAGSASLGNETPALVAALQNFPESSVFDARTVLYFNESTYPPGIEGFNKMTLADVCGGEQIDCETGVIPVQASAFAQMCRSLDLGARYQAHLDSVFKPLTPADQPAAVRAETIANAFILRARNRFEVLTHLARMQQHIGEDAYKALLEVAKAGGNPVWQGGPVSYSTLRLFSKTDFKGGLLQGVLMIESHNKGGPIVVYMPGEPDHPLREYESLDVFVGGLRRKLDDDAYLLYFERFISLAHRAAFAGKVRSALRPKGRTGAFDAKADLQLQRLNPGKPPFLALHEQAVQKMYDDARLVAVPTRENKPATRQVGYEILKEFAHALFDIADIFLPASEVRDLLKDAFFGIESWSAGETEEALSYLYDIGKNLALISLPKSAVKRLEALEKAYEDGKRAAELIKEVLEVTGLSSKDKRTWQQNIDPDTEGGEEVPYALVEVSELEAQGGEWVEKATPPSEFIESLVQVTSRQGEVRLWKPTLVPLEQPVVPPKDTLLDERSLFTMGGRTWLSMDRRCYEVSFDSTLKKWRVENPGGYPRYAPILETNGAGAWRYEGENPMGWDASTAFRRLHGDLATLSEVTIQRILQITEVDEALLRRVHVDKLVPPALLMDCAQRFRIDDELSAFIHLMEGKGTGRIVDQLLSDIVPEGSGNAEPEDSFVIPDIKPYLDFITTLPGWPEGRSLRRVDGRGKVISTHGPVRATRSIDVAYVPGKIDMLLDGVLAGLSSLEMQLLLINYSAPRTHREYLAYRIASEAKGRRETLFTQIYGYRNRSIDPLVLLVKRDFPSLPDSVVWEILGLADRRELDVMITAKRVPLRMAEAARGYLQQLRVNRTMESFFFTEMAAPDSSVVTFSLVDTLPAWPPSLVVDVRNESFEGPQVVRLGDKSTLADVLVLVHAQWGYQTFDSAGQRLDRHNHSLLGALLALLPQETRSQTGLHDKQSLALALGEQAIAKRDKVKQAMGLQKIKPGVKWPLRLPDGRIGYPLSGRMRSLFGKLKSGAPTFSPELAVQNLYPQFSSSQVKDFLVKLVEGYTGGPDARRNYVRARLHELTAEYRALENALDLWKAELLYPEAGQPPGGATLEGRETARIRILSCWRRENEVTVGPSPENRVHQLGLSNLPIGDLPAITANFDHVGQLLLDNLALSANGVEAFIGRFSRLSTLSLRSNLLEWVPIAVGNSYGLERLVLSNNPLVLDGAGMARLQRLSSMQTLELEGNGIDIRVTPDLRQWPALREVKLRGCGLTVMPAGLGALETLRHVDLRHNQIVDITEDAFRLIASRPLLYVRLHHNPLSAQTITRASHILDETFMLRMGIQDVLPAHQQLRAQAAWLLESGSQEQHHCLESLRDVPDGDDFFRLLDDMALTAEYRDNRHVMNLRAWRIIEATCASDQLREELFEIAAHPTTCGDGTMLMFNLLDVHVLVFNLRFVQKSVDPVAMFKLVRGLERLDELENIALEDFNTRLAANVRLDQAEIRLVYPTRLRNELELPGQAMTMLFESLSGVTQDMLDSARDRVIARESTPAFLQSLISREVWMGFLQEHYAQRFAAVKEPFHERLEALDTTDESKYLQDVAALSLERKAAVDALALQMTQEMALAAAPAD